jgi:hypothetical protein
VYLKYDLDWCADSDLGGWLLKKLGKDSGPWGFIELDERHNERFILSRGSRRNLIDNRKGVQNSSPANAPEPEL